MSKSLIDLASITFQSVEEFLAFHGIILSPSTSFEVKIPLQCLYEIYCEQSTNLLDFGTFCAIILGNTNTRKTTVAIHCTDKFFFRERTIAYVYRQKKEKRFKKIPSFRS